MPETIFSNPCIVTLTFDLLTPNFKGHILDSLGDCMWSLPKRTSTDGRTDGRMDGQTGWFQYNTPPPYFVAGDIIMAKVKVLCMCIPMLTLEVWQKHSRHTCKSWQAKYKINIYNVDKMSDGGRFNVLVPLVHVIWGKGTWLVLWVLAQVIQRRGVSITCTLTIQ